MTRVWAAVVLAAVAAPIPARARSIDAVAITMGDALHARTHVRMVRVALQRHWPRHWFAHDGWYLGGYWELGLGYWRGNPGDTGNRSLEVIDFRPVLRWQYAGGSGETPDVYLEVGTGPALLSRTEIENRRFSTAFQFGSHIGLGMRFGPGRCYEISYRLMHYSNANLKFPNNGMTFNALQFTAHF